MCPQCKGHSGAHYVWCVLVGGPGYHPGSLRAHTAAIREHHAELAQRSARETFEEQLRRSTNNGWVKYQGSDRSYDHLDVTPSERPDIETVVHHTEVGRERKRYLAQKPGREVPQEIRELIDPILTDQSFRYYRNNANGRGKPRIITPDGRTYILPKTPSDWRTMQNLRADLRKLGAVI